MALLVVDDDPSLRQVLERVLAFEGYDVETVPTGYDALERMQVPERGAATIDLIVLDLDEPWVLDRDTLKSKCKNSPFDEARLTGRVVRTLVAGRTVHG